MRAILAYLLRRAGKEASIEEYWTSRDLLAMTFSMALGIVRGTWKSFFFRSSGGLALVKNGAIIKNPSYMTVGRQFIAEEGCEINAHARRGVVFGDRVTVGAYALIRPSNYYGGAVGEGLRVGSNSNIGPYCYIGCSGYIEIGDNVMMGPRVSIFAENHNFARTDVTMKRQGVAAEFVKIEDDCWIASHSVILAGVTIGKGSIVSAGSVVTKDVPPYSIVGGVPAKLLRSRLESVQ
ncbi:MAG: acyltransferase [Bacteroidetes bacterium]|nr:acyltransferase [Bacteroidota bacterium]MCW5896247.1 acyltransferase [Bacteroidota bacterium]